MSVKYTVDDMTNDQNNQFDQNFGEKSAQSISGTPNDVTARSSIMGASDNGKINDTLRGSSMGFTSSDGRNSAMGFGAEGRTVSD